MSRLNRFFIVFIMLSAFGIINAQSFKGSHLQAAYQKLQLDREGITINISEQKEVVLKNGQKLTLRTNDEGRIEHIGIPLFNEDIRTLLPSPIYDYLEFALLRHKYKISENTLQEQKIMFRNGSWDDLEQMSPEIECTIDNRDDKWYIVSWFRDKANPLTIAIPINYELLANSTRKEMETNFARDLRKYRPEKIKSFIVENEQLESIHRDGILVKKGRSFLLPEINSDIYFKLSVVKEHAKTIVRTQQGTVEDITFEEETPLLLISSKYPKETWANILLTPNNAEKDVSMNLELLFTGYHKDEVKVNLLQWMGYCNSLGCTPYYIYEKTDGSQGSAILLMHNVKNGYAHLAYLHSDINHLEDRKQTYTGKVYMYIPTSNVKDLFAKADLNKSSYK